MILNEHHINKEKEIQNSQNKMKLILNEDFEKFNKIVIESNLAEHKKNYCMDLVKAFKSEYNEVRTEIKEQFKKSYMKIETDRQSLIGSIPSYMHNYTIKELLNILKQISSEVPNVANPFKESESKVLTKNKNESRINKKSETPKFIQSTPKFNTLIDSNNSDKKYSTTKKQLPNKANIRNLGKTKPVLYSSPVPEKVKSKKNNTGTGMRTPDKKNIIYN
jgi:hypothetical protein